MDEADLQVFSGLQSTIDRTLRKSEHSPLPHPDLIARAACALYSRLPDHGSGLQRTTDHLIQDVALGLNGASLSPTYYGFVTGGITPAARLADNLVTLFDQNAQVHLPEETITTIVEDRALCMLLELLNFGPREWPARIFTTGATAGNIIGLACGREYVISEKLNRAGLDRREGEGLLSTCLRAGIESFQVLTTLPHSSLGKAANIVGIGSATMLDVSKDDHFLDFDMPKLEKHLANPRTASIVVISCGEVNTGGSATHSIAEVQAIRRLCDQYDAWLHVDGAFGLLARVLPAESRYAAIRTGTEGLELADSIAGDGHKLLNVPYDCGFFFCRSLETLSRVCQNTNAAYLSGGLTDSIVSPLNIRLENSARFRGLPVYATLAAYGRSGYEAMVMRMVDLARKIAKFIKDECSHLELLPRDAHTQDMETIYMCVLFRAKDDVLNETLTQRIKASRRVYPSGTKWEGKSATRFAIAKWDVNVERDFAIVAQVLRALV